MPECEAEPAFFVYSGLGHLLNVLGKRRDENNVICHD